MKYLYIISIFSLFFLAAGCSVNTGDMPSGAQNESSALESGSDSEPTNDSVESKTYSMEEVALHNTAEDCWFVIDGKVYDVSGYGERHPGSDAVYQGCGKDATELFETRPMGSGTPHSDRARGFLPNFEIGTLNN